MPRAINREFSNLIFLDIGDSRIKASTSLALCGAAIFFSGAFALIGCFGAKFLPYDDSEHIDSPEYKDATSAWDFFQPKVHTSYIPLAYISYRADRWLHERWTRLWFADWAPGVRLDTFLLHAGAALFLWRMLACLRFSPTRAFFIALIFACHPLACETVCWVSERKNALAVFFGFAALWAQTRVFKPPESRATLWRWAAVCTFFAAALLGKPSALGLLPIMIMIELIYLHARTRSRFFGNSESAAVSRSQRSASVLGLAALACIAFVAVRLNLFTHSSEILSPPGGTVFTAVLTDLEIVSRYLFNLVCPTQLSAMYYIDPIRGLDDPRAWKYAALLSATIGGTLFFARNRWICAFGWFWFFAALGPNANLISIAHWMQDRYLYLPATGFWIAFSEFGAGLSSRVLPEASQRKTLTAISALFAACCIIASTSRGYLWSSLFKLGVDATKKQPQSFYAHYALGCAVRPRSNDLRPGSPEHALFLRTWREQFLLALQCPDADRYNYKQLVATELGQDIYQANPAKAELFFKIGATPTGQSPDFVDQHGISLAHLSMLDLYFRRDPEMALDKARESLQMIPSDYGRFALANALVACAQSNVHAKEALLAEARKTLAEMDPGTGLGKEAAALLNQLNSPPEPQSPRLLPHN